jgi:predicted AAA+ superfamily ATPase
MKSATMIIIAKKLVMIITLSFSIMNIASAESNSTKQSDISYAIAQIANAIYTQHFPRLVRLRDQSSGYLTTSVDLTIAQLQNILDKATQLQILADFYNESTSYNREKALSYIKIANTTLNPEIDMLETIASDTDHQELKNIIELLQNARLLLMLRGWSLKDLIEQSSD